ncbi:NfeD family protein [Ralstonia solanacearum]|uniref:Nodulation protein NfeD n=2 Tax=Ralstonia solanacearum TaxID=305 RepID=A0AAW5ZU33_RALSL|nr:nodulation protein NfeD [Ralstonia solanacearum]AST31439.2 nodulation protein NfeD [Ralstonia solanacearum]MBB6591754.1 nodulation protein NfeD [Ralstonia solanacearum]MBB6595977.1 nodulation protein NfeD [Ralstonia solanacearum]MDB0508244.1 nodulation protein NfeD [Ralstonia solanacearum]MDB0513509.1 nodulation protein NfeD [Ralstonia solanacearum]
MRPSLRIRQWTGWLAASVAAAWSGLVLAAAAPVMVLPLTGAIGPASAAYVVHGLELARKEGMQLVVLQMDTPGGLDASMRQIIQAILASPVPVAGYVAPGGARAASAGTYILYASHIAAMAPATNLGAASPVAIGIGGHAPAGPTPANPTPTPGDTAKPASAPAASSNEDTLARKQMHDAAAYIRGLAQLRGRNADWAERAVREAVSLSADEAATQRVIDLIAANIPDLLKQVDGRALRTSTGLVTLHTAGAAIETLEPDWRNHFLAVITDPSLALLLLTVGVYALIFEFSTPGMVVPGILGAMCILVALYGLQMLPINYAGLALLALGLGCMVAEAFLPTFGALGVGGIVAFILGAVMLIDTQTPGYGVPIPVIVGLAVVSLAVILALSGMAVRARRRPKVSGGDMLIGMTGEVVDVDPLAADADSDGWAHIHGERWRVRCDTGIARGDRVRVIARQGLTLMVEPVAPTAAAS